MQIIETRIWRNKQDDDFSSKPYVTFCGKNNTKEKVSFVVSGDGYMLLQTSHYDIVSQAAISIPVRGRAYQGPTILSNKYMYMFRLWMNNQTGKMEFSLDGTGTDDTSREDWTVIAAWPIYVNSVTDPVTVKLPLAIYVPAYSSVAPKHIEVVTQFNSDFTATSCVITNSASSTTFLSYMWTQMADPGTEMMYVCGNYKFFGSEAQATVSTASIADNIPTDGVSEAEVREIAAEVVADTIRGKYTAI